MALSHLFSTAFLGLEVRTVKIEVDTAHCPEKTAIVIVGLPDSSVRESKDRVLTATKNSGYPIKEIIATINLAPGDLKKEGPLYDLPIALGLLRSQGILKNNRHEDYLVVGELGLGGETQPIRGALAIAMHARSLRKKGILLPAANAKEAEAVPDLEVVPIKQLREAVQFLEKKNPSNFTTPKKHSLSLPEKNISTVDFSDVKGQDHAKRALEIAAAGNHNILLSGPPGSGKTMLAKALSGIMPLLTIDEILEITKIHSIAGYLPSGHGLMSQRPFRSPHHTVSYAGLIGGGTYPRPGEVSLAHHGILFLDELPEFSRSTLEVLRQPLEDRKVTISRAQGSFTFPTNFLCVAAMNPCPCGFLGHPEKPCKDTELQVNRYRGKISGPLLDRIDMHIDVPALRYHDLTTKTRGETSKEVRKRVIAARQKQYKRYQREQTNSLLTSRQLREFCSFNKQCEDLMKEAIDVMGISARAYDRVLRVARTIADLANSENIEYEHLMEAINFRSKEQIDNTVANIPY